MKHTELHPVGWAKARSDVPINNPAMMGTLRFAHPAKHTPGHHKNTGVGASLLAITKDREQARSYRAHPAAWAKARSDVSITNHPLRPCDEAH